MKPENVSNYINIGLLIIAIIGIISPTIATILNNIHDTKIRKLENINNIRKDVLTNFALYINQEYNSNGLEAEFRKYLNLLYLYFDVDDNLIFNVLNSKNLDLDEFQENVTILMKNLSKQIKKYK